MHRVATSSAPITAFARVITGFSIGVALLGPALAADSAKTLSCAPCHRTEAAQFDSAGMAHALLTAAQSEILKSHPKLMFREGPFSYAIERHGNQSWYTLADGQRQISLPVEWAFGLGAAGQTYVVRRDNAWYEGRVSYYRELKGLDLTVGAPREVPGNLDEAVGRRLSVRGLNECFNCHSTGALRDGSLHTESLTPGVQCRRCHEDTEAHVTAFQHPQNSQVSPPRLSALTAGKMSEFCGQCHRTWVEVVSQGPHDINNVRFQPYRLANARCWDPADARIRCTACHDPHSAVAHAAGFSDSRCLACHSGGSGGKSGAKVCLTASANCATCHMPKIRIPGTHHDFTDHWIRIVRPGEPLPI